MAVTAIYQGKTDSRDVDGITSTRAYVGTRAECEAFVANYVIGTTWPLGVFRGYTITQYGGKMWQVELRFQNANGTSGTSYPVEAPDYTFGEYSATIDCSMMSTPLEIHKNAAGQFDYLCNWNQYLLGKSVKVSGGTTNPPALPAWWATLGANASTGAISPIPDADQQTYQWADYGTLPQEDGYVWFVLKTPTMAGYQSYDRCLYTLTESARYRTYANAVAAIAGKANKTGTPTNNPGSPFVNGNWKCDRAQVEWTGEFWRATLTWTYAPDGWNPTLYQAIS